MNVEQEKVKYIINCYIRRRCYMSLKTSAGFVHAVLTAKSDFTEMFFMMPFSKLHKWLCSVEPIG